MSAWISTAAMRVLILIRDHWLTCLKIPQSDGYSALVMPNPTTEPAARMKLPSNIKGDRGRARTARTVPLLMEWRRVSWTGQCPLGHTG